jgi:FKBP-type peptidyl-prolyl cis-trans isomerase
MMTKGNNRIGLSVIAGIIIISISSCNMTKKYEKEERDEIQNYITSHSNLDYEKKASGLYYLVDSLGTGPQVAKGDSVFVMYTGYYLDGTKFGTNYGTTDTLKFIAGIGQLIPGFDEAITYMKEGSKSKIVVPSYLAYGTSGYYMAAYTPLLFDIYLARLSSN